MGEYYIGPYRDHYAIFDSLDRVQTQYDTHAEAKADLDSYNKTGKPLPESASINEGTGANIALGIFCLITMAPVIAAKVMEAKDKRRLKTGKGAHKISYEEFSTMYNSTRKLIQDVQRLQKSSKYYKIIYKYNTVEEEIVAGNKSSNILDAFKKGSPVELCGTCVYYEYDCIEEYKDLLKSLPEPDKDYYSDKNEDYVHDIEYAIQDEFNDHLDKLGFADGKDHKCRSSKYPGIYISYTESGDGTWFHIYPDCPGTIVVIDNNKLNEDHSEISNDPEIEELLNLAGCTIEDLDTINNEEDIELDDDDPIDVNTSREIDAIMDESTEARNKLNEIRKSEDVKNIKLLIKEGNKLTKTDLDLAAEKYEEAKNLLVELRKEINTIPNDDTVSGIVYMILNLLKQTFTEPITIFFGLYRIPTRIHKMSKYEALVMYDKLVSKLEYGITKLKLAKKKNNNNKITNESFLGIKSKKEKNAKELTKDEFDKLINDMVSINDAIINKLKTSKWWKFIYEPCMNIDKEHFDANILASNFKRDFSAGKLVSPSLHPKFIDIDNSDPRVYTKFDKESQKPYSNPKYEDLWEEGWTEGYYEAIKLIKDAVKKLGFNEDGKSSKYPDIEISISDSECVAIDISPIYTGYYKLKDTNKSQNESIGDFIRDTKKYFKNASEFLKHRKENSKSKGKGSEADIKNTPAYKEANKKLEAFGDSIGKKVAAHLKDYATKKNFKSVYKNTAFDINDIKYCPINGYDVQVSDLQDGIDYDRIPAWEEQNPGKDWQKEPQFNNDWYHELLAEGRDYAESLLEKDCPDIYAYDIGTGDGDEGLVYIDIFLTSSYINTIKEESKKVQNESVVDNLNFMMESIFMDIDY